MYYIVSCQVHDKLPCGPSYIMYSIFLFLSLSFSIKTQRLQHEDFIDASQPLSVHTAGIRQKIMPSVSDSVVGNMHPSSLLEVII